MQKFLSRVLHFKTVSDPDCLFDKREYIHTNFRGGLMKSLFIKKWPYLILVLLGVVFTLSQLIGAGLKLNSKYEVPQFKDLNVSQGILSFTPSWKNSGGQIVLRLANGQKITMTCQAPFDEGDRCFFRPGQQGDMSKQLVGKLATAWWEKITDPTRPQLSGRVYQLKVDDYMYYDYAERTKFYMEHVNSGVGGKIFFAVIYFYILIFLPFKFILKEK